MRQILCPGHSILLEVKTEEWGLHLPHLLVEYSFKIGEAEKELLRYDWVDVPGDGSSTLVEYVFKSYSLTIDGVKVVDQEKYTSQATDDLFEDQVHMNGREFTASGKVFKLQVNRNLY